MHYPKIEKPTEPGRLYWFRRHGRRSWSAYWCSADVVTGKPITDVAHHIKGDWRGPIPEPSDGQERTGE